MTSSMVLLLSVMVLTVVIASSRTFAQPFTIDVPNASLTQAFGINDKGNGEIVGIFTDSSNRTHGFLRDVTGRFAPIDVPNASLTQAFGINNTDQIVGAATFGNQTGGFLLDVAGHFTYVVASSTFTQAFGINNLGTIAGPFSFRIQYR
jgi:hypothetical protein